MFNAVIVKNDLVQWIKDWFEENGKGCNAIIGISGGKDSSVVAALCVEALGKDRVIGVMMPNWRQDDISDSYKVIEYLDIRGVECNIGRTCDDLLKEIDWAALIFNTNVSKQTKVNLPARIRMTTLFAIAQSLNGRVSCNCNLSEDYIGYSTFGGDDFGSFGPLRYLTSDEVIAIGDVCGLPDELTHKVPSDGLCGKTDEDNLGFTYEVLNKYIRTGICEDEQIKQKIDMMHKNNLFKLQPMQCFEYKHE